MFFLTENFHSQSSFGIRHEPFRISIKYDYNEILAREASITNLWSESGLALSYSYRISKLIGINSRLGYVSNYGLYRGPEFTLACEIYYWKDFFICQGINLHENIGGSKQLREDIFISYLVSIGVKYKKLVLSLEYQLPLAKKNIAKNEMGMSEIQNILRISYGFEF
jgi:hypothetical protein